VSRNHTRKTENPVAVYLIIRAIQNHSHPGRVQKSKIINQIIRTKTGTRITDLRSGDNYKDSVKNTDTDREYIHTDLTMWWETAE